MEEVKQKEVEIMNTQLRYEEKQIPNFTFIELVKIDEDDVIVVTGERIDEYSYKFLIHEDGIIYTNIVPTEDVTKQVKMFENDGFVVSSCSTQL